MGVAGVASPLRARDRKRCTGNVKVRAPLRRGEAGALGSGSLTIPRVTRIHPLSNKKQVIHRTLLHDVPVNEPRPSISLFPCLLSCALQNMHQPLGTEQKEPVLPREPERRDASW